MTAVEDATAVQPAPIVDLRDLHVQFAGRGGFWRKTADITAVDGISLAIERGHSLGLVGATGSGKSTIAQVVMGMVKPTSGTVRVGGRELNALKGPERLKQLRLVQVVMQDPYSSLDPRMNVGEIIAQPLTLGRRVDGETRRRVNARVAELLTLVGLHPDRAARYPHQFSGGQRQRIAIARALAPRPQLIVLDEPTSALDVSVRAQILNLLKGLQDELGVTYLVISHDLVTVSFLASDVAVMHLGRVVERAPVAALFEGPRHPYTIELLASMPGATGRFLRRTVPADVPAESLPAEACRYAFRCSLRAHLGNPDRCLEADPQLEELEPGHAVACHFPGAALQLSAADVNPPS